MQVMLDEEDPVNSEKTSALIFEVTSNLLDSFSEPSYIEKLRIKLWRLFMAYVCISKEYPWTERNDLFPLKPKVRRNLLSWM